MSKVLANVVLGGYDESRFVPNDIVFPFGADDSRPFTLGMQSISGLNTLSGSVSMLTQGVISLVDSTVPHSWLPREVCDQSEKAFGLTYNNLTDLYIINSAMRSRLLELNATITFKLGTDKVGGSTFNIVLPYAAFDLQAKHPLYENATNYPIRRGANDTQYVLDRTFLQEAYLVGGKHF